jgi:enoyl-[acyl-carrier protein] reductase I
MPCDVEDHRQRRRDVRPARGSLGRARLRRPRHRLLRQERAQGPLCRHDARELLADHGDFLLLVHRVAKRAAALMPKAAALITLTYGGATRVMPNYNVMGVAKAALEASVRYLAGRLRPAGHPRQRPVAGAGAHPGRRRYFRRAADVQFPARPCAAAPERVARRHRRLGALSLVRSVGGVTGEVHHVDSGYNIMSMPRPEALKTLDAAEQAVEDAAGRRAGEAAE